MSYLVFSKQNVCYLLVDASAVNRHPLFFANLISSCVSHESLSSLELWRCIFYGSWQIVLGDYIFGAAPDALKRFVRPNVIAIKRAVSRHDEICTIFYELDSGVFVKKCTLASLAGCQLNGSPIFFGMAYDMYLQDFAARQMWEEWRAALLFFIDEAFARFYLDEKVLQGDAIDAVARNAVLNDRGRVDFFDLECAEYICPSKTFFYIVCAALLKVAIQAIWLVVGFLVAMSCTVIYVIIFLWARGLILKTCVVKPIFKLGLMGGRKRLSISKD